MEAEFQAKTLLMIWLFCIFGVEWTAGFTATDERRLKNDLLMKDVYAIKNVRPQQVTQVELSFNLLSINNVDIKNEQFSLTGWWSMKWRDPRLSWQPSGYANIPVIQVHSSEIWTPALVVDNSVDKLGAIHEDTIPLKVTQDGLVTWNPPGIVVTSCDMNVKYFPFDWQTCSVEVTSFGYTMNEVDISVHTGLTLTYYQEDGEWTIEKKWNERYVFQDDGYDYAKVAFYLQLQRRPAYYGLNIIFPVLLTSLLIPLVFLLPHDAGEKTVYSLTVLLSYVVLLNSVTDGLPTTSKDQSLLGVYIALILCLSAVSVGLNICSLYIFHRNPAKPIPHWLARLTRSAFRVMYCKCYTDKARGSEADHHPADERGHRLKPLRDRSSRGREEDGVSASSIRAEISEDHQKVSWHYVAEALDAFLLRFYFASILLCALSFMIALGA